MQGCVKGMFHKLAVTDLKRRDPGPRPIEIGVLALGRGAIRLRRCESSTGVGPRLGTTARRLDLARVA